MSDMDPALYGIFPEQQVKAPAEVVDAAPSSTEPPAEIVVEPPAVEVAKELRTTPEGVILSKVSVSPEGVVLKVED